MTSFLSPANASIAAFAAAGFVLGLAYFAALWRTVALLVGGSPWIAPVALTLGRIAGAVALLGVAVRFGAPDLLATFAGILAARLIALGLGRRVA